MTPVLFRTHRHGEFAGEVTAVFPTMPSDYAGKYMTCYAHTGQHGSCSFPWYWSTVRATPDQYVDLLAELRSLGYADLRVYQRMTPQHRATFRAELARINAR